MAETRTIYEYLLDEGTDVWRPVQAVHVDGPFYRILGTLAKGEAWEFQPGETVLCKPRIPQGGGEAVEPQLIAVEGA